VTSSAFPDGFLWGAATSAHQTEGNNINSNWWALEQSGSAFVREPSGDACDSYHRWGEDMDLLAAAGFHDYRFSIEWARIEPSPGQFSTAHVMHYRAMVEGAAARGLRPMVTLHHFTVPRWFDDQGGWTQDGAVELFSRYVDATAPVLDAGVQHVCTINEPNIVAMMAVLQRERPQALEAQAEESGPATDSLVTRQLTAAHHAARDQLHRTHPLLLVGWSVAAVNVHASPGAEHLVADYARERETVFYEAARGDDWVGVQSYSRHVIREQDGRAVRTPPADGVERTLNGWEYHPPAAGEAVREAARIVGEVPIIVTENGIATEVDQRRVDYTTGALDGLRAAIDDGVDVRGYFHWSLLDNYEWGSYQPTFGLVAVDRQTFARDPKPSLAWLGSLAPARD
jgi:beta-glucosidase